MDATLASVVHSGKINSIVIQMAQSTSARAVGEIMEVAKQVQFATRDNVKPTVVMMPIVVPVKYAIKKRLMEQMPSGSVDIVDMMVSTSAKTTLTNQTTWNQRHSNSIQQTIAQVKRTFLCPGPSILPLTRIGMKSSSLTLDSAILLHSSSSNQSLGSKFAPISNAICPVGGNQ